MNKISAGYRFTFNSYDIRKENPYTIIKEGLNEKEANFLAEVSEFIQGGTYLDIRSSNPDWRIKNEHEKLYSIFNNYSSLFTTEQLQNMKEDVGYIMNYISENITGYTYDENIDMRILNDYKIENIPEDIFIKDVTLKFKINK